MPKYHETYIQILSVLNDKNKIHYRELAKKVRDTFYSDLPKDLLEKETKTGANVLLDRIGWAKSYLKQAKMLFYPETGIVQITEKGLEAFKRGKLTNQDLKNDLDYINYQKEKEIKKASFEDTLDDLSPQDMIDFGFNSLQNELKNELLDKLKESNPYYFEKNNT